MKAMSSDVEVGVQMEGDRDQKEIEIQSMYLIR